LHILAPVPHVPAPVNTHAAQRVRTEIYRHVDQGKPRVAASLLQGCTKRVWRITPIQGKNPRHRFCPGNIINMDGILGRELLSVLVHLQPGDGAHPAVIEEQNAAPRAMLYAIDQDLRIHREGAIPGERQGIEGFGGDASGKQGGNRETHVGSTGFGIGLAGMLIFHDLESIRLDIPGIKKTRDRSHLGPVCGDLDRGRLGEDSLSPVIVR